MPNSIGEWVGLVGGLIGIVGAGVASIAFVLQYFATREELRIVDCQYHYRTEIIEAQAAIKVYADVFPSLRAAAAKAEILHNGDKEDESLLIAYREAVEKQNDAKEVIERARAQEANAKEEIVKCRHPGEENFQQS